MHFNASIFYSILATSKKRKEKTILQVLTISNRTSLKCLSPSHGKHLVLHHLTAPARNVGTINKLYYSALTFQ